MKDSLPDEQEEEKTKVLTEGKDLHLFKTMDLAFTTAQKGNFPLRISECDQFRRKLQISLHLLKKFLMENFIFCAVYC